MKRRYDVVGVGLAVYDTTHLVEDYPAANVKIDALEHWHGGGGPIPTALVTLARWGVGTAYIGRVGDDLWGQAVYRAFQSAGVDVSWLEIDPGISTPVASLIVERTGARTAVLGREHYSEPHRIPPGVVENSTLLHLDGREPRTCRTAAERARASGVGVSLDAGSPRRPVLDLLPLADHVVVAERFATFAAAALGLEATLDDLWRPEHEALVITRGEDGAIGRDRTTSRVECPAFAVSTVDTTGAGDVYHAGYLYGVLQGWSLARRMTFAAAAAALATTALGARGHLPARTEVEALVREREP
jgi:sugar/nucleoside kinase (ribokinase family)